MKWLFRLRVCVLAFVTIVSVVGCASLLRASYKDDYIQSQLESYVYNEDFGLVWGQARSLLFERGYQVRDAREGRFLETDWLWTDTTQNERRRYMVSGFGSSQGFAVQFQYVRELHNPGVAPYTENRRDYDLEYVLLKRVNKRAWQSIETAAENDADRRMASQN